LFGALLTLTADLAARTVAAPAEIPLGVLTALLGAPFFLALLWKSRGALGG
ncbi:iron chelate uptake ABC transporter family permease subunit, partial [Burkholderia contaminans]